MTAELFQPDRFSDPLPHFAAVGEAAAGAAGRLVEGWYEKRLGPVLAIEQSGGAEIDRKSVV